MIRASLSRRTPGLVALCLGVSVPGPCIASTSPAIVWEAPAGCPDADALTTEIGRHVDLAAMASGPATVTVRVRQDGERWSVAVAIAADGGTLERTLAVASCEAAVSAAALMIAIAVDPERHDPEGVVPPPPEAPAPPQTAEVPDARSPGAGAGAGTASAPQGPGTGAGAGTASAPQGPSAAAPGPVPHTRPEPALTTAAPGDATSPEPPLDDRGPPMPARRRAIQGLVQIGPAAQVGMLPLSAGLQAAAGLLWSRVRLACGYTRWLAAEVRHAGERPYGADLSVHAGHVRVGPLLRAGPLEVPLHVGFELGALRGTGVGGDANYTATTLWGVAMVGAGLAWAPKALRGHMALAVLAEAALSLRRPQFVFAGDLEVHRVGPAAFRGFLAIEARFP